MPSNFGGYFYKVIYCSDISDENQLFRVIYCLKNTYLIHFLTNPENKALGNIDILFLLV